MDNIRFVIGLFFVCFSAHPLTAMEIDGSTEATQIITACNVSNTVQAEAHGSEVCLYTVDNAGKKDKFFAKNFAPKGSSIISIKGLIFFRGDSSIINEFNESFVNTNPDNLVILADDQKKEGRAESLLHVLFNTHNPNLNDWKESFIEDRSNKNNLDLRNLHKTENSFVLTYIDQNDEYRGHIYRIEDKKAKFYEALPLVLQDGYFDHDYSHDILQHFPMLYALWQKSTLHHIKKDKCRLAYYLHDALEHYNKQYVDDEKKVKTITSVQRNVIINFLSFIDDYKTNNQSWKSVLDQATYNVVNKVPERASDSLLELCAVSPLLGSYKAEDGEIDLLDYFSNRYMLRVLTEKSLLTMHDGSTLHKGVLGSLVLQNKQNNALHSFYFKPIEAPYKKQIKDIVQKHDLIANIINRLKNCIRQTVETLILIEGKNLFVYHAKADGVNIVRVKWNEKCGDCVLPIRFDCKKAKFDNNTRLSL